MEPKSFNTLSRRQFIRQAACAALGTSAMTAAIRDLRFINAAVAQSSISDYKALVCIFLGGGNDSNNLIIPTIPAEYNNYANIRKAALAIPQANILNLDNLNGNDFQPLNSDGHEYGLHPACPELRTLFGARKLAVLFNTGTLLYPTNKTQYNSFPQKRPPQLFSHADQVTQWQTSVPDQVPLTGWGGRCADLLQAVQPNAPVSLSISLAGANTFEVGNVVSQYAVSTSGAISLQNVSGNRLSALTNILGLQYPNMQVQAYSDIAEHAITTGTLLNSTIAATVDPASPPAATGTQFWTTRFPTNGVNQVTNPVNGTRFNSSLGPQLKMIARLIEAGHRAAGSPTNGFGMKRQIFFCQVGGYDLHSGQTDQPTGGSVLTGQHSNLLAELSQCMNAFQAAMEQIGTLHGDPAFSQRVTAFTCSDFGRTFPTNGQGSDHGWGNHHLIMGGAVQGRKTYGTFPVLTVGGPDDTSTGRWIPTIACDQYFSTLASWFGVDSSNLGVVFPNLGRFSSPNLGFI
jgi:uncharacterized protein (DUF1501 family)